MLPFLGDWLTAAVAASIAKTMIAPLERVKLILQVQQSSTQFTHEDVPHYKGILDCLIRLPREQGFNSYWRGNGTNIIRSVPTQAFSFAFNDLYRALLGVEDIDKKQRVASYYYKGMVAGGAAGLTTHVIMYPVSLCQTRMSADIGDDVKIAREFLGFSDCFGKIYRTSGICGLYCGFYWSAYGILIYRSTYFGLYFGTMGMLQERSPDGVRPSVLTSLGVATVVTSLAGLLAYPHDTVSRRMMMQSGKPMSHRTYKSGFDCWTRIVKEEGIMSLYRGGLTNVMRSFGAALILTFYDQIKYITHQNDDASSSSHGV